MDNIKEYIEDHPELFEESVMIFLEFLNMIESSESESEFDSDDIDLSEEFAEELRKQGFSKDATVVLQQYINEEYDAEVPPEFIHWMSTLGGNKDEYGFERQLYEIDNLFSIFLMGLESYNLAPTAETPF